MDNKQNQPNSGQPTSSPANAANKPASQPATPAATTPAAPTGSANTLNSSRQGQQPAPASTATTSAEARNPDATRTAAAGSPATARKSWLDQDQWTKSLNELPKSLKDLGTKALDQVNSLSPTQKVVGGALLVSGLSWLALRGKSGKTSESGTSRYTPKGESKWKSSSESVYRGSTSAQRDNDFDTDSF
jgi:hypothetical protein